MIKLVLPVLCGCVILSHGANAQQPIPFQEDLPAELSDSTGEATNVDTNVDTQRASVDPPVASLADGLYKNISWRGSLMFERNDLNRIYAIINDINISEQLPELVGEESAAAIDLGQGISVFVPAYHLQSILYYATENWTVWLNGQRNRVNKPRNDRLKINYVSSDHVVMTYSEPNINDIVPGWRERFLEYETNHHLATVPTESDRFFWEYISPEGNILIDPAQGGIRFSLQPTQSFVVHELSVVEGKALGKSITFKPGQGRISESVTTELGASTTGAANASTPDQTNTTLSPSQDLMNQVFNPINQQ